MIEEENADTDIEEHFSDEDESGESNTVIDDSDDEENENDSGSSSDDSDSDNSIDPEVARERFATLREQHTKTLARIAKYGRSGKRAKDQIESLAEIFKQFRLVPKQFDALVLSMKNMMKRVRFEERQLQKVLVDIAGCQKMNSKHLLQRGKQ